LRFLFGIVIGCGAFFSLFMSWPTLALVIVAIVAPAIIRTGSIEHRFRHENLELDWRKRTLIFVQSLGVLFNTTVIAVAAFLITCLLFSVAGYGFGHLLPSSFTSPRDAAFVGAASGVVWGISAAIVAVGWYWFLAWYPEKEIQR
jgi:ABC-type glycerol-3-phosphate transport system permease component